MYLFKKNSFKINSGGSRIECRRAAGGMDPLPTQAGGRYKSPPRDNISLIKKAL